MSQSWRAHSTALNFLKNGALLLCLFAPSLWMMSTIPPLWRDVDAYNQLTRDPLLSTFWGHGLAHSYAAKVPLFLGAKWEQWRGRPTTGNSIEPSQPPLTDSGVALLIAGQHLALCAAALYFITAVSARFWVRLGLALIWASNGLSYTFAHCVGSESLGLIFLVLFVAQVIRLVRDPDEPSWVDWYVLAIALCGCILSRQLNLCLVALLPAVFLAAWAQGRVVSFPGHRREMNRLLTARYLQRAFIATGVALSCLAVTTALPHNLARKTKFHPHSRIGFTFLWRLHFLDTLTPASRTALFEQIRLRARSNEVRRLVTTLEQLYLEGRGLDDNEFMQRGIKLFNGPMHWKEFDLALNQQAFLFLWPPAAELIEAAKADFFAALKSPPTEVSSYLFDTTAYYFAHKEAMPDCANLVTFRGTDAAQISSMPTRSRYLMLWQGLTFNRALLIWAMALVTLIVIARRVHARSGPTIILAVALNLLGLAMFAASCLLVDNQPRFRLPMWQMLFLSFCIVTGATADLCARMRSNPPNELLTGKEKSAGQLPRLG